MSSHGADPFRADLSLDPELESKPLRSSVEQSSAGQSNSEHSAAEKDPTTQSTLLDSQSVQSEAGQSEAGQSEAGQSGAVQSGIQSGAGQLEARRSEKKQSRANRFRSERSADDAPRARRRRRIRRRGRRAYIRSVYFLPSLATLGNAVCGFASMYVAGFDSENVGTDPMAMFLWRHKFFAAAYLVFFAMVFDGLDGRLARFARHTTDFGGQLDSLADVISFGAAPAYLALMVFKADGPELPFVVSRLVWAIGVLYFSCAMLRLARFNVSNETGEQHHFSFLGLPSPGAGGAVVSFVLMQQDLLEAADPSGHGLLARLAQTLVILLPLLVLATGLLMISNVRYPHVINRYLRGRRSLDRLIFVLAILLLLLVAHRYAIGIGMLAYVIWGVAQNATLRLRLYRKT